jgi:hypothetical protein
MIYVIPNIFVSSKIFAYPDYGRTDYLWVKDKSIPIEDGMKADHMDLRYVEIHRVSLHGKSAILYNANFEGSNMTGANISETVFRNCSFKDTNLTSVIARDTYFYDCDFDGAIIDGAIININREQLLMTKSYRVRFVYHQGIQLDGVKISFYGM